jgi:hypothetical protein
MRTGFDWRAYWNKEEFEKELAIKFKGPGLYTEDEEGNVLSDTILVVPVIRGDREEVTRNNVWHQNQPEGTTFEVMVWNCRSDEIVFFGVTTPPSRDVTKIGTVTQ